MQYISAYALASLSGNEPTADTITNILKASGKPFDQKEVKKVVDALKGKNVEELIKKGMTKVGSGSGSGSGPAPAAGKKEDKKKQQKKPQAKKKEPEPAPPAEEEDMDGPGDLFG